MRKFLLILAIVCGLALAALAVFIATFDADRYRPLLTSQLQHALGKPVQLQRISLAWRQGVAVQLQGLTILEDARVQEPLVQVDSVSASVHLLPLLRRDVQVSSIVLEHPRVHVVRDANGTINLLGLAAVASPTAASRPTAVGGTPVTFNIGSLRIHNGTLHWTDAMAQPPMDLTVNAIDVTVTHIALGQPMDVDARAALGVDVPNVHLAGRVTPPGSMSHGAIDRVHLTVDHLALEQLLPVAVAGQPNVRGLLTGTLDGQLPTLDSAQVMRALSAHGSLKLTDGRLEHLNILRMALEKLSILPGLMEQLEARLPESYKAKLTASDTVFTPIDVSLQLESGALRFDNLHVGTDTFRLVGTGTVGLDGVLNIRSTLSVESTLSAAIIKSVRELQALANASGELEFPMAIQGRAPQISVLPDLRYIGSKVVVTKAVDLLGRLIEKGKAPPQEGTPNATPGDTSAQQQAPDLLDHLIQRALQKRHKAESQPP